MLLLITYYILQVYLDLSNIDYATKNFIFVKKEDDDVPKKIPCPKKMVDSVALIIKRRFDCKNAEVSTSSKRIELLKNIKEYEDAFVEYACKTFV